MDELFSPEWWKWTMYRQVADLIHQPSEANEAHLRALITEYRLYRDRGPLRGGDEHEYAMDYC